MVSEFLRKSDLKKVEKMNGYKEIYLNDLKDEWYYADQDEEIMPIVCRKIG